MADEGLEADWGRMIPTRMCSLGSESQRNGKSDSGLPSTSDEFLRGAACRPKYEGLLDGTQRDVSLVRSILGCGWKRGVPDTAAIDPFWKYAECGAVL